MTEQIFRRNQIMRLGRMINEAFVRPSIVCDWRLTTLTARTPEKRSYSHLMLVLTVRANQIFAMTHEKVQR